MTDRMSIRAVILGLGTSSVLIASCLAGFGLLGVQEQLNARERAVVLEATLKNHDRADAVMDSVRTDVLRPLQTAIGVNQTGSATIRTELAHHVEVLTTTISENQDLPIPADLHESYRQIDLMLPPFVAASYKAIDLALTDPAAGSANFDVFRSSFTDLEQKMDSVRAVVRGRVAKLRMGASRTARLGRIMIFGSLGGGILLLSLITGLAMRRAHRITSALAASQEEATHHALHDTLTGLPNRRLFTDRLQHALLRSQRENGSVALLYLDLDRFKQVNDTLGHPVGDALLRAVADRVRECLRKSDTVARLGGDEFTIIQSLDGRAGEAEELARRVIASVSEPYHLDGADVCVSTSIGIAIAPLDASEASHLLSMADQALYTAKAHGGGTACRFNKALGRTSPVPNNHATTDTAPGESLTLMSHG